MASRSLPIDASALRGGTLVVIGGDLRAHALERLELAFSFSGIIHCPTRQTDSSAFRFEAVLRRSDISLVLWLSGLTRSSHGRAIRDMCRRLGIPYLPFRRIPHPNALRTSLSKHSGTGTPGAGRQIAHTSFASRGDR